MERIVVIRQYIQDLGDMYQEMKREYIKGNKKLKQELSCLENVIQFTIMLNKLEANRIRVEKLKSHDK